MPTIGWFLNLEEADAIGVNDRYSPKARLAESPYRKVDKFRPGVNWNLIEKLADTELEGAAFARLLIAIRDGNVEELFPNA